jgi:hypothetical protein
VGEKHIPKPSIELHHHITSSEIRNHCKKRQSRDSENGLEDILWFFDKFDEQEVGNATQFVKPNQYYLTRFHAR